MSPEINLPPSIDLFSIIISDLVRKNPGHEAIIGQIIAQIDRQPQIQEAFIASLFNTMATEGNNHVTDMRDAALTILADAQTRAVLESNPRIVWGNYIQSVGKQSSDHDPFSGSIATLLDAGKFIASIVRPQEEEFNRVIKAWAKVGVSMREPDQTEWINQKVQEIKYTGGHRRSTTIMRDNDVEILRKQGLSRKQIAEKLCISLRTLDETVAHLLRHDRVPRRRQNLFATGLDIQVEALSRQGFSRKEMATKLGLTLLQIISLRAYLLKAGRTERLKQHKTKFNKPL